MTFTDDSGDRLGRHGGEPVVPGILLHGRRYDAGAGEVWAGQVERLGVSVTVRYVRLPADSLLRAEALDEARSLLGVRHPHLASVVDVIRTPDGLAVVTEPVHEAVSLSRLLGARGRLDPGEVVTIGLPAAQALAEVHAAGLHHGGLTALDILLEPNGRPVLTGAGVAALTDPGVSTAEDVHDLADLLLGAMRQATGPDAAAVAVAVAMALVDDPRRRPSAAELAAGLARSATPLPVRMTGVAPGAAGVIEIDPESGRPVGGADATPVDQHDLLDPVESMGGDGARDGVGDGVGGSGAGGDRTDPWSAAEEEAWPGDPAPGGPAADDPGSAGDPPESAWPAGGDDPYGLYRAAGQVGPAEDDEPPSPAGPPRDGRTAPVEPADLVGSLRPPGQDRAGTRRRAGRAAAPARPRGASRSSAPGAARARRAAGERAGSRRRHPVLFPVLAGVGLVIVAVAALLLARDSGSDGTGQPAPAGSGAGTNPTATPVSGQTPEQAWRAVLDELNDARSRAFERADAAALTLADASGSAVLKADQDSIGAMAGRGAHSTPVRIQIVELTVREENADRVVLRVTETLAGYDFVDSVGTVLDSQPAGPPETKDLTLTRTEAGWRLAGSVRITPG
ncbi:protein kinase [Parafrankia discariae]|uniref:protein kinase n=1 Tax=Parafrankia discariae TaxID=365528 RepID=UPI000399E4D9|nr:protein kinase [Parafrankia discariae]